MPTLRGLTMVCSCSIHACDLCTLRSRPPLPSSDFITSLHMPATRSRHFTRRPSDVDATERMSYLSSSKLRVTVRVRRLLNNH